MSYSVKGEAIRIGIPVPRERHFEYAVITWRHETITVHGKPQIRYRDFETGKFIKKPF